MDDGGHIPRLMCPKEKTQPSAPLTTDWSTSATVPEQTSAWGRAQSQAGTRSGDCHPASHHKVAWLDTRTNDMEISRCTEHTLRQDRHTTQAAQLTDRHMRVHPIHTSWTQPGPRNSTRVVTGGSHTGRTASHTGLVRQLPQRVGSSSGTRPENQARSQGSPVGQAHGEEERGHGGLPWAVPDPPAWATGSRWLLPAHRHRNTWCDPVAQAPRMPPHLL